MNLGKNIYIIPSFNFRIEKIQDINKAFSAPYNCLIITY